MTKSEDQKTLELLMLFCTFEELCQLGFDEIDIAIIRSGQPWGVCFTRRVGQALFESPAALRPFDSPEPFQMAP